MQIEYVYLAAIATTLVAIILFFSKVRPFNVDDVDAEAEVGPYARFRLRGKNTNKKPPPTKLGD